MATRSGLSSTSTVNISIRSGPEAAPGEAGGGQHQTMCASGVGYSVRMASGIVARYFQRLRAGGGVEGDDLGQLVGIADVAGLGKSERRIACGGDAMIAMAAGWTSAAPAEAGLVPPAVAPATRAA
ncbi:MAG: hypothetical protein U5N55_09230 [Cypionkella sp.]|nr:hypothetical protein [Cypionkella sp.]